MVIKIPIPKSHFRSIITWNFGDNLITIVADQGSGSAALVAALGQVHSFLFIQFRQEEPASFDVQMWTELVQSL